MSRTWLHDQSVTPITPRRSLAVVHKGKKALPTTTKKQASLISGDQLPLITGPTVKRKSIRWGMYAALLSGLVLMALMITGCSKYALPFGQGVLTRWSVGQDKVASFRLDVGHNGPSHFLTEYWQGQAVIIEFVGGDAKNTQVYVFTVGSPHDQEKRLVTLHLATIPTPSIVGKPHLLVQVEGMESQGCIPLVCSTIQENAFPISR